MKKYRNVLNEKIGDSKKTYSKKEEEKRKKENKEKSNKKDSTADNIDVDDLKKNMTQNGGSDNGDDNTNLEKKKEKKRKLKNIVTIENRVKRYIVGQDYPVRQVITAMYKAQTFNNIKSNILIIGKSGTGKTETIKQISRLLKIPYTIEDATKFTSEGYYGRDVVDMIYDLLNNADNDYEKARRGILAIDEIDKEVRS